MKTPAEARALVKRHGSQRAAARAVGVSCATLRHWLNPERNNARQRRAWAEGRHWGQRPENREGRREAGRRWEQSEAGREYHRIKQEGRRRDAGVPLASAVLARRCPVRPGEVLELDVGPFVAWLHEIGCPGPGRGSGLEAWCAGWNLDASLVRRLLRGEQALVHIDTVDRALLRSDMHLWQLYPELYAEEVAA